MMKSSEPYPRAHQRRQHRDGGVHVGGQVSGKGVDDVAEQNGLDKCRHRQHDIRERQRDGEARLGSEQAEYVQVRS